MIFARALSRIVQSIVTHQVVPRTRPQLVPGQPLKQLGRNVLVREPAHLNKELITQDADVRLGQCGGREDVDQLTLVGDRLAHQLADGGVDLLRGLPVVGVLLVERGLRDLEEAHGVADRGRFVGGGAECKGARQLRHGLHPALLAILLFEDMLLSGSLRRRRSVQLAFSTLAILASGCAVSVQIMRSR